MVALVGLTHMVPSTIDNGRHRIMVFEGNQEIRSDLSSWLQSKQMSGIPMRRATRSSARDANEGDGTNSEPSNTSEDSPVFLPIGNEVASDLDPTAGVVEGITVDWTTDAAIPGGNPALHVPTNNPMVQGTAEEDNNTPTVHSGREQQVKAEVQEKIVAPGSTVNDNTIGSNAEVQSAVGTSPPRSAVLEAGEWAQSISALVYEADGDYYVDRLNRMWMQEHPPAPIEVVTAGACFRGIISKGLKF
jgi:hypothetical protein